MEMEASVAFAAGTTGTIKSLDPGKGTISLHNRSTYMAPKSVKFSDLKVSEKVTVSYAKARDKMGTAADQAPRPDDPCRLASRHRLPAITGGLPILFRDAAHFRLAHA